MAKKKPSFRDMYSTWSATETRREQDANDPRNRQAKGEAILNGLIADGEQISDEQYGEMLGQFMTTGNMSMPEAQTAAPALPQEAAEDMPQMSAISSEEMYDRMDYNPVTAVRDMGNRFTGRAKTALADTIESVAPLVNFSTRLANYAAMKTGLGPIIPQVRTPEWAANEADRLREVGQEEAGRVSDRGRVADGLRSEERGFWGELGMMARNPTILPDIAAEQSGNMLAAGPGLLAGPAGMVVTQAAQAAGSAGDQAYERVLADGGTEEEAEAARTDAAGGSFTVNTAIPAITPGGMALESMLGGRVGESMGRSVIRSTLTPLVGETASETLSEALDVAAVNVATGEDFTRGMAQAAAQGFAIGAGMGAAPAVADGLEARERRTGRERDNTANILKGAADNAPVLPEATPTTRSTLKEAGAARNADAASTVDRELYWEERAAQKRATLDEAFKQREAADAAQAELEQEAGFQTIERDAGLPASRVERYADVIERVPVNPPAEVTPEQVQDQRDAAAKLQAESARVKEINQVAGRRSTIDKKAAEAAKKAETKAAAISRAQRTKAIDELITANPKASDAEIADMLPAKIAEISAAAQAKAQAPTKKVAKKAAPAKKQAAPAAEALKKSSDPTDRFAAEAMEKLGLNMAGKEKAPATKPFVETAKKIGKALAGNTSQQAAAAERLLADGRLIIAPNAKSVGRSGEGIGEYDIGTGKLYVYADQIGDDVVADLMEAASHETGHAEQFTDDDARPRTLEALVGKKSLSSAAAKIRAAAKKGNRLAQEAVEAAEADTAMRAERGDEYPNQWEDYEIGAYLIGAENRGRTGTLGQAGGAIRDLVSGAKEALRSKGVNVDVSINDLRSAAGRVMQESAKRTSTATTGTPGNSLNMIIPSRAAQEPATEREYVDPVDGETKFVISDSDSEITSDPALVRRINDKLGVPLSRVLHHDELYKQLPQLRFVKVQSLRGPDADKLSAEARADENLISINPLIVEEAAAGIERSDRRGVGRLRSILLHESQHIVQSKGEGSTGGSPQLFFTDEDTSKVQQAHRAQRRLNDEAAALLFATETRAIPDVSVVDMAAGVADDVLLRSNRYDDHVVSLAESFTKNEEKTAKLQNEVDKLWDKYDADYRNIQGEREAYWTELNRNKPLSDLALNPTAVPEAEGGLAGDNRTASVTRRDDQGNMTIAPSRMAGQSLNAFRNKQASAGGKTLKYGTFIMSLLRNDKGLGTAIRNSKELATALPAVYEAQANQAAGAYDTAIKKMAAEQGTTAKALNKEIEGVVEKLYEMEGTPSEYAAAFNEAMDKYGKAGDALKRLRQLNTDLSKQILQTYMDQGGTLSESEKGEVRAIAANLGRYTHRFYAAKQGRGLGKMYSDSVMDAVAKESKGKKLTPAQKELFDVYTRAAKKLGDDIVIPDAEEIGDLNADQIDYLYRTWHGTKDSGLDTDAKIEALLNTRDEYGAEDIKAKTDEAMQSLLYGIEGVADQYYNRGGKINTGILQKRSKMPKEIRELLGEITDPATVLLVTASKQAELVARTRMLIDFKNQASPEDLQSAGLGRDYDMVKSNNMTPLTGDGYGPLEGMYASPAMRAMIDDTRATLNNFTDAVISGADSFGKAGEALGTKMANMWMKGAATSKAYSIVGNLFRYGLNGLGAMSMPLFSGNTNLDTYLDAMLDASRLIRYAHTPSAGLGSAENAVKYRVVDSATVGDLKLLDLGKVEKLVKEMSGKSPGTAMRWARKIGMTARETYAMMDVWAKIANFKYETEHLTRMYEAAGIPKTEDDIMREASDIVSSTNIGYNRSMPLVKALERAGFSRFGPYMYDVMRIQATNAYQGLKEMTYTAAQMPTAAAKGMSVARGASRLAGQAAVLGMWAMLSQSMSSLWGDDEEDKRSLLPEFSQVQDFTPVGMNAEGQPVLYAVSQVDPIEPFTAMIRAARLSDDPLDAVWDQFKELYIAPALAPMAWTTAKVTASNVLGNDVVSSADEYVKTPLLQEWMPQGYEVALGAADAVGVKDKTVKAWNNLLESVYVPGTMRAWTANNPIVESFPEDGKVSAIGYNVARSLGARGTTYDPNTGAKSVAFNYSTTIKNTRSELAEFVANRPNATTDQIISKMLELTSEEKAAWDQIARVKRGMVAVGLSEEEALAMLKSNRVPVEVLKQVSEETFTPRTVNEASFTASAKKAIAKKKSPAEKKAETAKWERAWEVLQEIEGDE